MPPPLDIFQPTPLSVLSTMTRKYDYRYPQGEDDVTAKKTFRPFDTSAHLMWVYNLTLRGGGEECWEGKPIQTDELQI